jgi:hypothetical protein
VTGGCRNSAGLQWILNYEYEKDAVKYRRRFRFEQVPAVCPATTTPRLPVFPHDPCLHGAYTFRGFCDYGHIADCPEIVIAITMPMVSACLVNFFRSLGNRLGISKRHRSYIWNANIFFYGDDRPWCRDSACRYAREILSVERRRGDLYSWRQRSMFSNRKVPASGGNFELYFPTGASPLENTEFLPFNSDGPGVTGKRQIQCGN